MSIRRNSQRRDSLSLSDHAPAAKRPQIVDPLWMISVAAAFLLAVLAVLVASG